MAKAKQIGKKTDAMSGLKMVGGAAAGAAVGSLTGPIGAAVGAVAGGIAGAKADEIVEAKPARALASTAKKAVGSVFTKKARKAVTKTPQSKVSPKKASSNSRTSQSARKKSR